MDRFVFKNERIMLMIINDIKNTPALSAGVAVKYGFAPRASFEASAADYNYQKAIEYADVVSRPVYEEEARVIDAIQKEILAL